ncbi:MAG TPA: hypothetical protein VMF69_16090 [Gemmataceae bacterium]|nr:hypothetical protein [Gemmataceae bacterium]
MTDYRTVFYAVVADPRYQTNLDWGEARPGHPEGSVRAHIAEIERNLEALKPRLSEPDYWKLKVLPHTHDSFKRDAEQIKPEAKNMAIGIICFSLVAAAVLVGLAWMRPG